jgi:transcription-repair coupling factor (superfamily II helicase)
MALYRRLNQAEGQHEIESLAAEMIDRFGDLPQPTKNLVRLIEIKHQAITACIGKIDVGARGTLVTFHNDDFPDPAGLIAYVERLNEGGKETAKLRPDMKLVINRAWGDPLSRLNGLFQLTKGLSGIVKKAAKAKKAA